MVWASPPPCTPTLKARHELSAGESIGQKDNNVDKIEINSIFVAKWQ